MEELRSGEMEGPNARMRMGDRGMVDGASSRHDIFAEERSRDEELGS